MSMLSCSMRPRNTAYHGRAMTSRLAASKSSHSIAARSAAAMFPCSELK